MKPKTMILMVVAVGCGLGASYMTSRLLAERNAQPAEETMVTVLQAKQKISPWIPIKDPEKVFIVKEVPEQFAPKKGLKSFEDVKGKRLSRPLNEGDNATADDLLNQEQAGLAAMMSPGQRAIALKVNQESLAGGWVLPGSHVDVVSTLRGSAGESISQTIMQDMLVLAVDTKNARDPDQNSMLGQTVTLAAKPEEVQRLALATNLGELRLSLRPLGDTATLRMKGSKWGDMEKPVRDSGQQDDPATLVATAPVPTLPPLPKEEPKPAPEKVEVKVEPPKPVKTHTLTVISGDYVQKAVFILDEEGWKSGSLVRASDDVPVSTPSRPTPPALETPPSQPDKKPATPAPEGKTSRRK
jgi:pilus assembly protein CpaB